MIISASYRTDIPAFYGDWFMGRLDAGTCRVANPYGGRDFMVSLAPDDVDGLVFWTRNPAPFVAALNKISHHGIPFVVYFTVVGYPQEIDRSVPRLETQIESFIRIARDFGPHVLVWRYDPVVLSSLTTLDFHTQNFCRICTQLAGSTDEVVISFVNPYRKSRRNLDAAARQSGFAWRQTSESEAAVLTQEFATIATSNGMRLTICAQPQYLITPASPAKCIDADRLSRVAGREISAWQKGNRPGCLCDESRDIGAYDTCAHGCTHCYAVNDRSRATAALKQHNPESETLSFAVPTSTASRTNVR